ncbi:uncharacterized protein A4U43_C08F16110 [Asparagus officinalis]|nr:uncharacterized protein A4U43_C08F16110 [Asparagus officinalis]
MHRFWKRGRRNSRRVDLHGHHGFLSDFGYCRASYRSYDLPSCSGLNGGGGAIYFGGVQHHLCHYGFWYSDSRSKNDASRRRHPLSPAIRMHQRAIYQTVNNFQTSLRDGIKVVLEEGGSFDEFKLILQIHVESLVKMVHPFASVRITNVYGRWR